MAEIKICPIMSQYVWIESGYVENGLHDVECKQEKCAWWDERSKKCAIVAIASISRVIGNSTV